MSESDERHVSNSSEDSGEREDSSETENAEETESGEEVPCGSVSKSMKKAASTDVTESEESSEHSASSDDEEILVKKSRSSAVLKRLEWISRLPRRAVTSMADEFTLEVLKRCIAQLLLKAGWKTAKRETLELLTGIVNTFLCKLCKTISDSNQQYSGGQSKISIAVIDFAFGQCKIDVKSLLAYIRATKPVIFKSQIPKYPVQKESNLNFLDPSSAEQSIRPYYVNDYFPSMYASKKDLKRALKKAKGMLQETNEDKEPFKLGTKQAEQKPLRGHQEKKCKLRSHTNASTTGRAASEDLSGTAVQGAVEGTPPTLDYNENKIILSTKETKSGEHTKKLDHFDSNSTEQVSVEHIVGQVKLEEEDKLLGSVNDMKGGEAVREADCTSAAADGTPEETGIGCTKELERRPKRKARTQSRTVPLVEQHTLELKRNARTRGCSLPPLGQHALDLEHWFAPDVGWEGNALVPAAQDVVPVQGVVARALKPSKPSFPPLNQHRKMSKRERTANKDSKHVSVMASDDKDCDAFKPPIPKLLFRFIPTSPNSSDVNTHSASRKIVVQVVDNEASHQEGSSSHGSLPDTQTKTCEPQMTNVKITKSGDPPDSNFKTSKVETSTSIQPKNYDLPQDGQLCSSNDSFETRTESGSLQYKPDETESNGMLSSKPEARKGCVSKFGKLKAKVKKAKAKIGKRKAKAARHAEKLRLSKIDSRLSEAQVDACEPNMSEGLPLGVPKLETGTDSSGDESSESIGMKIHVQVQRKQFFSLWSNWSKAPTGTRADTRELEAPDCPELPLDMLRTMLDHSTGAPEAKVPESGKIETKVAQAGGRVHSAIVVGETAQGDSQPPSKLAVQEVEVDDGPGPTSPQAVSPPGMPLRESPRKRKLTYKGKLYNMLLGKK